MQKEDFKWNFEKFGMFKFCESVRLSSMRGIKEVVEQLLAVNAGFS